MPNARNAYRKAIHMLQRSSLTKLTNHRLRERRQKGLDTTGKRAKEHKTHKVPLNTHALRPKSIQSSPSTHEIGQRAK
jgi:hypothetical protein